MNTYTISTIGFGVAALFGIYGITMLWGHWFYVIMSTLIVIVALDNFFCATRFDSTSKKHYKIPPFLKMR